METTFMSIHNLTPHANILFASESIQDILGYQPHEVIGRSCFQYFHPDDLPFARYGHERSLELDKAAVLWYARIMTRNGDWVTCECVFSIAYDVLVACTSIYNGDEKAHQRNFEAKQIRRIFSSPPLDPRYHMLEHLKRKFSAPLERAACEPRAVLILNRFSRTLPIMYASDSIYLILGIRQDEIQGKSFYECIRENCLDEAIPCLERAKANDSIAYLRFYYRNPRQGVQQQQTETEVSQSSDSEDGGVQLDDHPSDGADILMRDVEHNDSPPHQASASSWSTQENSRANSGGSSDLEHENANDIFDPQPQNQSNTSPSSSPPSSGGREGDIGRRTRSSFSPPIEPIEVEAVISCTSDGLVVIVRAVPLAHRFAPEYANGVFATPWAANSSLPQNSQGPVAPGGPNPQDFMSSIRDVAVFAWALTGINGNIADYSHGTPRGQSVPREGLPVWDPKAKVTNYFGPENNAARRRAELAARRRIRFTSGNQPSYSRSQEEEALRKAQNSGTGSKSNCSPSKKHP